LKRIINYFYIVGLILAPIVLIILPSDFFDSGKSVCLSVRFFELTCYGCGLTRAIQHLIHFDLENALVFNKLSVVVLPILIFVWAAETRRINRVLRKK